MISFVLFSLSKSYAVEGGVQNRYYRIAAAGHGW